jgi:SAM-dependent methyltransferase
LKLFPPAERAARQVAARLGGHPNPATTAGFWDRYVAEHLGPDNRSTNRAEWLGHPVVQERHSRVRGGDFVEPWVAERYLGGRTVARGLGIGCGTAPFEVNLVRLGAVEHYDLYDVSQQSLDQALAFARSVGVEDRVSVRCAPIEDIDLADDTYDIVSCFSFLHHALELDDVVVRIRRALRATGVLFAFEYIGPDRFDFPAEHLDVTEAVYRLADPALKVTPALNVPTREAVIADDPTEAAHSADIVETLRRAFASVDVRSLNGCLPFTMWWSLNHDALHETTAGVAFVDALCELDDRLTLDGVVPPYFAYLAASQAPSVGDVRAGRGRGARG